MCVRIWRVVQMHVVGGTPKRCFGPIVARHDMSRQVCVHMFIYTNMHAFCHVVGLNGANGGTSGHVL